MEERDVIAVGAGLSGLAFAHHAAAAGRSALVLEASARPGGCLDTRRLESGFWLEMGAHTCYSSYGAFLELVEGCGLLGRLRPRGEARKRFALLRGDELWTMGPVSVFREFEPWELVKSAPRGLLRAKEGRTTYAWYSGVVGRRNYGRVLGPFLAAVPSQSADAFPATGPGSLFKKRPRRAGVARSFTFDGGLSAVAEGVAARPGVEVQTGAAVRRVRRAGAGFAVDVQDAEPVSARVLALAVPPSMAAALTREAFPELSEILARVGMASVETTGVAVARERCPLPELAFLVPVDDIFWSAVSRDPVPDSRLRGFAFHFKKGHARDEKLRRIAEVLRVDPGALELVAEKITLLPSPALGHASLVQEIGRVVSGERLAVAGNYFGGLAIEDCVLRSREEWRRVEAVG